MLFFLSCLLLSYVFLALMLFRATCFAVAGKKSNLDRDPWSLCAELAIEREDASYVKLHVHRERVFIRTLLGHCTYMKTHLAFSIVISKAHIERPRTLFWFDLLCPYIMHCCSLVFFICFMILLLCLFPCACVLSLDTYVDPSSTPDRSRRSVWMSCTSAIVVAADTLSKNAHSSYKDPANQILSTKASVAWRAHLAGGKKTL